MTRASALVRQNFRMDVRFHEKPVTDEVEIEVAAIVGPRDLGRRIEARINVTRHMLEFDVEGSELGGVIMDLVRSAIIRATDEAWNTERRK